MPGSTFTAARDRLKSQLALRPGMADVQLTIGHPGARIEREAVMLGGLVSGMQDVATLRAGAKPMDDRYSIVVLVNVKHRDGIKAATDRVVQLLGEVAGTVGDDHTLGDLVLAAHVGEYQIDEALTADGAESQATINIDVHARV
jgi:hypothetical protein